MNFFINAEEQITRNSTCLSEIFNNNIYLCVKTTIFKQNPLKLSAFVQILQHLICNHSLFYLHHVRY